MINFKEVFYAEPKCVALQLFLSGFIFSFGTTK